MKKSFLLWLIAIISLMTLTSCKHQMEEKVEEEQPKQEQTVSADESDNSNETSKNVTRGYRLQESDIANFPEVPNWNPEEVEEQLEQGYAVPQFIIDAYEKKGLNGKRMSIFLPSDQKIAEIGKDDNGQYYFEHFSKKVEVALFKSENNSITFLYKDRKGDRKLLGYSCNENDSILKVIHIDYKDESDAKLIDYTDDFTIIYYPETNEAVCIRYGKEIGPRTKIDPNLLMKGSFAYEYKDGAMRYNDEFNKLTVGFINEGRLIYPIILKNGEEVSFHLYVAAILDENVKESGKIEIDGIDYGIYEGKAYVIQNVIERQSHIVGNSLIVEDTGIHLQVQEVEIPLDTQETETFPDVQETETQPEIQEGETMPGV